MSETVNRWYDARAEYEWTRLLQDGYHQLEYMVTMHLLERYLPKTGLVLDAGGGPGRYTIELAKKGYEVILLDLSPECLAIARREIRRANVENRVREIVEGSVTDLSRFDNELFDAVLCLSPLSHLLQKSERELATSELLRVAKAQAPLFVSVFNLYGIFRTILGWHPEELTDPFHEELFTRGIHRAHYRSLEDAPRSASETDVYYFNPDELKELLESKGARTLTMATCQGLSSQMYEATNSLYRDAAKWKRWTEILLRTCEDPRILGLGNQLVYVGRK
jgi:ubiquinone/menaquinone biosynthesis C-methylase UbiE